MKIPNLNFLSKIQPLKAKNAFKGYGCALLFKGDEFGFNSDNFDKSVLVKRGIIPSDKDLGEFFDEISTKIFKDENSKTLASLLKGRYITLSTSCYNDLKNPYSATAVKLDPKRAESVNCAKLENEIKSGKGVGINFSEFNDPINQIKKINEYFKYRENSLNRPPAGIGLLNINHPKILDFITLKDNADYKDWCFDLSVIIPNDFFDKVDKNEDIILTDGTKIPSKTIYSALLSSMAKKGEPGVIFSDDKNYICDSCATAKLSENEGLTLAHINLSRFYNNGKIDYDYLSTSADIISKAMKNIDPNGYIGILGYQDLLNKMNLNYGEDEANKVLDKCLKTIKTEVSKNSIKMALSPTGGVSRLLKTSPSIEPEDNSKLSYYKEIDTLSAAQKYMDGNISKTVILKKKHDKEDVDNILRYAFKNGIKGISVFKP